MSIEVRTFGDPVRFRQFADPLLLKEEARNNLILGITGTLIHQPEIYPEFHLWAVEEPGAPVAAAAMTPPRPLVLADPAKYEAIELLAAAIADSRLTIPRVLGNQPGAAQFVAAWTKKTKQDTAVNMRHGVFVLDRVRPVPEVAGTARPATEGDLDLLIDWVRAFLAEADPEADNKPNESGVRRKLEADPAHSGYWIWELEGDPVSLSGHGGRTPNGIRIGPVYTPVDHRRRGYATALVAAHSRWLLQNGHQFCFLYTDLDNPTSNAIYRTIGYEQVAEATRYSFISR